MRAEFPISGFDCYDLVVSNGKHGGGHGFCNFLFFFYGFFDLIPGCIASPFTLRVRRGTEQKQERTDRYGL